MTVLHPSSDTTVGGSVTGVARERDRRYVWHTWSPIDADRSSAFYTHGEGYRIWDVNGVEYIDASALNSTCGYAHPEVVAAIAAQSARLHHVDLSVSSHEGVGLLAERLAGLLPVGLSRTLFVNSGSEGIDAALLTASAYWDHSHEPRSQLVAFASGYHGSTLLSRSMSGLPRNGHALPMLPYVRLIEPSVPARELRRPESLPALLAAFEAALAAEPTAAVVIEPFLNVGGGVVLPPGFLRGVRELCDRYGHPHGRR